MVVGQEGSGDHTHDTRTNIIVNHAIALHAIGEVTQRPPAAVAASAA